MKKIIILITAFLLVQLLVQKAFSQDNSSLNPPIDFGAADFEQFVNYQYPVTITYHEGTKLVAPSNYRLKIEGLPSMIKCSIDSTGQAFQVRFYKRKLLCNCFVSLGEVKGILTAVPKNKAIPPTSREFHFTIINNPSFLNRCWTCFMAFLGLIILLIYVYGIAKKPRFDSTAKFEVSEVDKLAIYAPDNQLPRKKLPTGFISRYMIPYIPETTIIDGMKIIAGSTKSTILIAKESISDKMSKNGETLNPKSKKDTKVFRNNTIEIEKTPVKHWVYTYIVH